MIRGAASLLPQKRMMMTTSSPAADREGRISGLFAVDIASFGWHHNDAQCQLRAAMYELLEDVFPRAGIPLDECSVEDRGDGALVVIPSAIPVMRVLGPLPELLGERLRTYNRFSSSRVCMRLRAAAHVGCVSRDDRGSMGDAVVRLFRMLNAEPFRDFLAGSGADLALAVSDYVYDSLISQHPRLVDPNAFQPLAIQVKETKMLAWCVCPAKGLTA